MLCMYFYMHAEELITLIITEQDQSDTFLLPSTPLLLPLSRTHTHTDWNHTRVSALDGRLILLDLPVRQGKWEKLKLKTKSHQEIRSENPQMKQQRD